MEHSLPVAKDLDMELVFPGANIPVCESSCYHFYCREMLCFSMLSTGIDAYGTEGHTPEVKHGDHCGPQLFD